MDYRTDNPVEDFNRHDAKKEAWLKTLPKCAECGHPIQQEDAVCIGRRWFCDDCLDEMRVAIGGD